MKKIYLSFIIIILVCWSCTYQSRYNPQQRAFDNFLLNNNLAISHSQNDLQKDEFMNKFEHDLFRYVDSARLFINWQGQISDIKYRENSTAVEFIISYKPEKYRKISFYCTHFIDPDSLQNDYIYNSLKNISNYSTVYFDGIIRTNSNETVKYHFGSPGNDLNIPYPSFEFSIIDIGTTSRSDSLSVNLQNAIDCNNKMIDVINLNHHKKISNKELKERYKKLEYEFDKAETKLTKQERDYLNRVIKAMVLNLS